MLLHSRALSTTRPLNESTVNLQASFTVTHASVEAPSAAGPIRCYLQAVRDALREWRRRHSSRAELRMLGQREIADFHPRLTEAEGEMHKPFWKA